MNVIILNYTEPEVKIISVPDNYDAEQVEEHLSEMGYNKTQIDFMTTKKQVKINVEQGVDIEVTFNEKRP